MIQSILMLSSEDDRTLFDRIRGGQDTKAYDVLFRRYYPVLLCYASQFVLSEDAENIVQDVLLYLWEKRSRINLKFSLSTYLHSAVKNRCYTLISRNDTRGRIISEVRLSIIEEAGTLNEYDIRELRTKLYSAINALPPNLREAFEKSRFEGLTYKEIAAKLSVSPKTIEYRVAQAIRMLRTSLVDYLPFLLLILRFGGPEN